MPICDKTLLEANKVLLGMNIVREISDSRAAICYIAVLKEPFRLDKPKTNTENMKTQEEPRQYILTSDGGKIAAALAKRCAPGEIGETLIRNGLTQSSFVLFLAREALNQAAKGKTAEQLADIFSLLSGGNASAARQALADCTLQWEGDEKKQSVGAYWQKLGGGKQAPNLSLLD